MARLPVAWLLIFLFHSLTFAKFHTPTLNHASGVVSNTTRPSQQSENESFALKSSSTTLDDARELVAKGQAAMARANAQILNNTVSEAQQNDIPALNYEDDSLPVLKRSLRNGSESSFAESYTVPTELVEAARVMAETSPLPENNNSKYLERSQAFKADVNQNDTFTMAPVLKKSNRLSELASESPEAYRFASNQSELVQPGGDQTVENQKRSASTWWMANIEQRGSSPFASKGYKVGSSSHSCEAVNMLIVLGLEKCQRLRRQGYGSPSDERLERRKTDRELGDGRKDDTEAINLAISDGGRCDQNCSGSTIYPATVYFPPGLYVVSSPILQFPNTEIIGDVS